MHGEKITDEINQGKAKGDIDVVPEWQHDRSPAHAAIKFQERNDGAGERDRTDGRTQRHFNPALGVNFTIRGNAKRIGRVESRRRHEHGSQSHQRVKRRHKLRHGCHRNAPCRERTDAATNGDAANDQRPNQRIGRRGNGQSGENGNGHARHAVSIAST